MALTSIYPRKGRKLSSEEGLKKRRRIHTKASNKWNYANTRRYVLSINKKSERDMLEWLEARKPYQTALKRLIRAEIARGRVNAHPDAETQNKPL